MMATMSDQPPYPPQDPNLPPSAATPPPTPPYGGSYGTPPPPPPPPTHDGEGGYGGYGYPAYDVIEAVKYGWKKFMENAGAFVVLGLLAIVIPGALSLIGSLGDSTSANVIENPGFSDFVKITAGGGSGVVGFLSGLAAQVASLVITAALVRGALDVTEGRKASIGTMFTRWSFLTILVLSLLVGLATTIGVFMCILPGLAVMFFTYFSTYFVVGEKQGVIDAIMSSLRFTADNIGNLLLLFLLAFVIVILGCCAFFVGLLVAIPVTTIAAAYTFKVLRDQPVAP
jgi:uncharacterized membrane protein